MRAPWVAAEEAAESEPCAFEGTVDFDRLDAVVAARRIVPADAVPTAGQTQPGRDRQLVETDQLGEEPGHGGRLNFKPQSSTINEKVFKQTPPERWIGTVKRRASFAR